jgi:hypothetical protein
MKLADLLVPWPWHAARGIGAAVVIEARSGPYPGQQSNSTESLSGRGSHGSSSGCTEHHRSHPDAASAGAGRRAVPNGAALLTRHPRRYARYAHAGRRGEERRC